ncbi:hypothetical protein SLE2022_375530 [Rubroshorea leprosula]
MNWGNRNIDDILHRIVIDPSLDPDATLEGEILFRGTITVVSCRSRGIGNHVVDVDADVVVVDVLKLKILNHVKLDGEQMVREVSNIAGIEQAEILPGKRSSKIFRTSDSESKVMAAKLWVLKDYSESKGSRQRKSFTI